MRLRCDLRAAQTAEGDAAAPGLLSPSATQPASQQPETGTSVPFDTAKSSTANGTPLAEAPKEELQASTSGSGGSVAQELRDLLKLALPLALQNVVGYSMSIISAVFIGRLGALSLSSYVLASSFYNVTGLSVVLGLCGGLDTLCGQVSE